MLLLPLANLLALLSVVTCTPLVVHQSRSAAPPGFTSLGAAPDSDVLTLIFALTPDNLPGLENTLKSISTPGNSDFRRWLSRDEVKTFMQPSSETVHAFTSFASAHGLAPNIISPSGDWVSLMLPVFTANQLFGAHFETFSHEALPQPITRTLSISLPSELVDHVEVIYPSTSFPGTPTSRFAPLPSQNMERRPFNRAPLSSSPLCDNSIPRRPVCLQEMYGIPSTPATEKNNSMMVTGYFQIPPNKTDVSAFLKTYRPDMPLDTTYELIRIANATDNSVPPELAVIQLEANLDVEWAISLATGVPLQFLSVGATSPDESLTKGFIETNIYLEGLENPPSVVTTSYAPNEREIDASVARKLCNGYLALGARGISVLFSSADGGVHGSHDNSSIPGGCDNEFFAVFPASCPYVTAVGGTEGFPEIATNSTGGGFSNLFPRPWYQFAAVETFLQSLPTDFPGKFNRSGRAYPDVSAQGGFLDFILQGQTFQGGGTSFSSPIFSAVIALINDRLVAAGKPVLGFLNPWIYANADAFTDVTKGHNSGYTCPAETVAFDATKGWDPLTGIGSPVFDKLLAAAFKI
ncbi:family S53 protease-like protein [Favolaschia claudopus]|uniref:Family S53 protease-like protein n=1 Tax=Favolaschia claudopus TaxID=2862362 RepID=A0AAW0DLQ2_9AGAR